MRRPEISSLPVFGEGGAEGAGWGSLRWNSPHPTSLCSATLPEAREGNVALALKYFGYW
jgi:hypothetical protein